MLLVHLLFIIYFFTVSKHFFKTSPLRPWYHGLFFLKICFGITYALIYTYYYIGENDSVCYHHDGVVFNRYFWTEPERFLRIMLYDEFECEGQRYEFWMSNMGRSFFMSKFISFMYIGFTQNYWLVTVYTSIINFLAVYYCANKIVLRYPQLRFAAILGFFVLPSVQLWTSGLLKESYALAGVFLCIGLYLDTRPWLLRLGLALVALSFIYMTKSYYLVFVPFLLLHYLLSTYNRWVVTGCIVLFFSILPLYFHSVWDKTVQVLLYSHDVSYYSSRSAFSNNQVGDVTASMWTLFKNFPYVVFSACFAPRHLPALNFFRMAESLSNSMVLASAIMTITYLWLFKMKMKLEVWMLLGYILVSAFIIGLTVPNFGAMVRIRVFYYPFVVFLSFLGPSLWLHKLFEKKYLHEKK